MNDSKAFIEYSNDMVDIYKNIWVYNPNKKRKISVVIDDMIADMLSNKKLSPIVTDLDQNILQVKKYCLLIQEK